ncbi:uncharacterized protein gpsm1a isoform X1 [Brachyhypopomus gauderio]|uniref:uncharacterized protein gpsm1a isoform X1 n=1 Tax=Brachyhypopomus gauderio TaxID=698409 RepID=UPI004042A3B5
MEKRRGLQAPQLNGQPREASSSARSPERRSPERRSPERRSPERRSPPLAGATSLTSLTQTEELFDLIASSQSRRLDEQRASLGEELGVTTALNNIGQLCQTCNPQELNDDFFNMLIKYQSSRMNDQRCSMPSAPDPDEDFFSLVQRVQAKRMDEQRVSFHPDEDDNTDSQSKSKPTENSS